MNRRELLKSSILIGSILIGGDLAFAMENERRPFKKGRTSMNELSIDLSFNFNVKDVNLFFPEDKTNFPVKMLVKNFKVEGNSLIMKLSNEYYKDVLVVNVTDTSNVDYPIRIDLSIDRDRNNIKKHINTEVIDKKITLNDNMSLTIQQINSNGSNRIYLFDTKDGKAICKYRTYYDIDTGIISQKTDMSFTTNNIPLLIFNDKNNSIKFFDSRFIVLSRALNSYLDFNDVSIISVDVSYVDKLKNQCMQSIKQYKVSEIAGRIKEFKNQVISVEDIKYNSNIDPSKNYVYLCERFISDAFVFICQVDQLTNGMSDL